MCLAPTRIPCCPSGWVERREQEGLRELSSKKAPARLPPPYSESVQFHQKQVPHHIVPSPPIPVPLSSISFTYNSPNACPNLTAPLEPNHICSMVSSGPAITANRQSPNSLMVRSTPSTRMISHRTNAPFWRKRPLSMVDTTFPTKHRPVPPERQSPRSHAIP